MCPQLRSAGRSGRFTSENAAAIPGSSISHTLREKAKGTPGRRSRRLSSKLCARAFLDGEREPGADDLAAALREAEPIRRSHAERLDQARRSLRGLEKPTIRRDRNPYSTAATPELGVRLFDLN